MTNSAHILSSNAKNQFEKPNAKLTRNNKHTKQKRFKKGTKIYVYTTYIYRYVNMFVYIYVLNLHNISWDVNLYLCVLLSSLIPHPHVDMHKRPETMDWGGRFHGKQSTSEFFLPERSTSDLIHLVEFFWPLCLLKATRNSSKLLQIFLEMVLLLSKFEREPAILACGSYVALSIITCNTG